jgi:hypothetical protein
MRCSVDALAARGSFSPPAGVLDFQSGSLDSREPLSPECLACGSAIGCSRLPPAPFLCCSWHEQHGDSIARSHRLSTSARRDRPRADHSDERGGHRSNTPSPSSKPAWPVAGAQRLDRVPLSSLGVDASLARTRAGSQGNGHGYSATTAGSAGHSGDTTSAGPRLSVYFGLGLIGKPGLP